MKYSGEERRGQGKQRSHRRVAGRNLVKGVPGCELAVQSAKKVCIKVT